MSDVAPAGIMMMGVRDSGKKANTTKKLKARFIHDGMS